MVLRIEPAAGALLASELDATLAARRLCCVLCCWRFARRLGDLLESRLGDFVPVWFRASLVIRSKIGRGLYRARSFAFVLGHRGASVSGRLVVLIVSRAGERFNASLARAVVGDVHGQSPRGDLGADFR